MRKRIILLLLVLVSFASRADEGMWLMHLLGEKVYQDMVKRGLKLSKEQLYSLNKASIKDAIIIFGNGCTGEVVSAEGLIFTNHHCGYSAIAAASSADNNYLRDGFWALSKKEEIAAQGLTVQFLVSIEDVTSDIEQAVKGLSGAERSTKVQAVVNEIIKKKTDGTGLEGRVSVFFKGNQYLLFLYERYRDIRLVGAPPESIGKFGGDTDNWEWPRHTGDFAVFRVYSGKDGKPADHHGENVPLKPKYFLPVSAKGVKDGDFAMTFGYPGSTNRYETSYGVKLKTDIENPSLVNLRDARLKFMLEEMKKDPQVKLKLASSYASIANYWKFFDGERKQLLKYDVYGQKQKEEKRFQEWAKGKAEYENILSEYEKNYEAWRPYEELRVYLNEGIMGSPLASYTASLLALERTLTKKDASVEEITKVTQSLARTRDLYLAGANLASDEKIMATMLRMFYNDIEGSQHPAEFFKKLAGRYGDLREESTYNKFAADVFKNTMVLNNDKWNAFMAKPDSVTLQSDPAFAYVSAFVKNWMKYSPKYSEFSLKNNDLGRAYMKGIMEINRGKPLYSDANFTMRVSYGNVKSYRPRDAVFYDYVCTLGGAIEKYVPGDYEFDLPQRLIDLYNKKDFGPYKDPKYNDIVVCYITTNDITGGNSGSPVINANGELIGLAFDGNYEALSHKIAFDKNLNRTICVDIRYVLFVIDKLGGAKNIIQELTIK
jgi:hypothetical protein